jgi:hypothetical protein
MCGSEIWAMVEKDKIIIHTVYGIVTEQSVYRIITSQELMKLCKCLDLLTDMNSKQGVIMTKFLKKYG